MSFEIRFRSEWYSTIDSLNEVMEFDSISYEYGCIRIGNYFIPLNAIIYIKNLG